MPDVLAISPSRISFVRALRVGAEFERRKRRDEVQSVRNAALTAFDHHCDALHRCVARHADFPTEGISGTEGGHLYLNRDPVTLDAIAFEVNECRLSTSRIDCLRDGRYGLRSKGKRSHHRCVGLVVLVAASLHELGVGQNDVTLGCMPNTAGISRREDLADAANILHLSVAVRAVSGHVSCSKCERSDS